MSYEFFDEVDPQTFRQHLNREAFSFHHRLVGNPLFEVERLSHLAELVSANSNHFYHMSGQVKLDGGWAGKPLPAPLSQCVRDIASSRTWIILKHCEQDPEYRALMEKCIREFGEMTGWDLKRKTSLWELQVVLTSPRQLTPYHMDNECAFLFHLAGKKTLNVFDQKDRSIVTEQELENFWMHDASAAKIKPGSQARAKTYYLEPGQAVHFPINAPHCVENGDDVSISVNINTELVGQPWGSVFQANYYIRKLGLNPVPPGQSVVRDRFKHTVMVGAKSLRKPLVRLLGRE